MKSSRQKLFHSVISLLLCFSMLVGTTFAWFTDSASSGTNTIAAGNLDIELEYLDKNGNWKTVNEGTEVLDKEALWEPGYTEVAYLKITNAGDMALKYALGIGILSETGSYNMDGEYFKLSSHIRFGVVETTEPVSYAKRADAVDALQGTKLINEGYSSQYELYPEEGKDVRYATLVLYMPEETTNVANYATGQNPPQIQLGIKVVATQLADESDVFGDDYDTGAEMPGFDFPDFILNENHTAAVTKDENNKVAAGVTIQGAATNAVIPEGVQLKDGADKLTLEVNSMTESGANVVLGENDALRSLNVHVEGVSANNTKPMEITIQEAAAKGLNAGNLKLYHVENGTTVEMTAVDSFTAHNQFKYDPATGDITLYMATFSEVALVADTVNAWDGKNAEKFNGGTGTEADPYIIANADQLAYLNECVSNNEMYGSKHYKLVADINLGGEENANEGILWYPIGYWAKGGEIAALDVDDAPESYYIIEEDTKTPGSAVAEGEATTWYTYGGSFRGTFDGAGHTISNIYQNTWQLKGNYSGNYWNAAMGLFGYVNGGTVKNLTVDNFSSDGEFTPTGVIAAYATNSTFENIAITHCNPRVYNTGNGGIVGIGGNSNDPDSYKLTFTNITIDNTNKISALWGSWDVACGGLVGMFRGAGHVYMKNCHIAAQIDVFNDVCGNYQYYWYRYAGMMIGTNKNMTTDANGYTVPETSKFHAEGCTVHFGEWNDYYYCELVANSLASYTHDHQFSRLEQIESLDEIKSGNAWTKTGNFLLVSGDTKTCYHIVKNSDGTLKQHLHADAGEETVNGETVLKEDKQIVYLPFNQLFTGYGWGVKHIPVYNGEDYAFEGITILDREAANSVEKFEIKFTGEFLYRVGNNNTVSIGSLFKAKDGVTINDSGVHVTIDKVDENSNVSGTFADNDNDWTKSTIQFVGTGVVKVTIQDYEYCEPTVLYLEVIDAVNATSATSATKNNVVLLNDCGFSSLEVSDGYTLYGNGFTMTCGSDSAASDMGYAFVTLNNGTLDNVQIVCPNFDYAVLYKSNMTESGNRSETDASGKTRYYNVKSGVMASGNSQILNSRISGGRAAVNVSGGNVVIDNSRVELGVVASILVGAANSLTLRDVTLVQKPTVSSHDSSKTLMGFSVLLVCDANGDAAPVTLEGTLVQNAWVDENDKNYVPSAGQSIISTVLAKTEYLHDIDGDGTNESLNLGFAYMPESLTSKVNTTTITDNRTNKEAVPYDYAEVSILNGKTYVYSYKNTNGTDDSIKTEGEYKPETQSDIITVSYSDTAEGLTAGKSYGTDGWVYELNVDLDKLSGYALNFSKLSMSVNGVSVNDFKVNGSAKPTSPVAVTAGGTTYILTANVNDKDYTATYKVTGTETSKESPSLVASNYEAGLCVASSYGGTWHGAAPALVGIQIKYWSVAESQYKTITLSDYTPTTAGKQNGTNTTWTYSPDNGDFTLTLTGGQVHSSNNVYAMPVVCAEKLYFVAASSNGLVNSGNSARTIPVSYTFKDNNNGDVLTFSHTWSVAENKDAQYSYSDFCNGTMTKLEASSGGGCVTPDTLITLADGSQTRVDSLTGNEQLLVWNLETGSYDTAPIVFVDNDPETEYEIIHLYFSDGSDVKVIYEHGFFDLDLGKYVYIDAQNYADYVGHRFVTEGDIASNDWNVVTLDQVVIETEVTTAWSPVTFSHLCYYTNGVLSMPGGIEGLFNIYRVDTDTMSYDAAQKQEDIETYGLFTIEDFGGMIPMEAFEAFNGKDLKVAMGKGLLTWEDIAYMAERYVPLMK